MARKRDTPDRHGPADAPGPEDDAAKLLEDGDIAEAFDAAARQRFGKLIAEMATRRARKQKRRQG